MTMAASQLQAETGCTLSVIIPTHNVRGWIKETLRSILVQDVDGMEIIVVDDGSVDGTPELVESIAAKDDRVTVVRAQSKGGGSARNEGVARARGKYIVFADGDDIVPRGAYRALVSSLTDSGSDVAIGDYLKFSPTRTWRPTASMRVFDHAVRGVTLVEAPTMIFSRPCWNKAFDRGFWNRHGIRFPDVPRSNDIVPMMTAYIMADAIDVIDDVVYLYRDRPGNTSMTAKASSSASFLSYLSQEMACADLIASVHDTELAARYSALIYDRDGFFHARKYLAVLTEHGADSDKVSDHVSELLSKIEPPATWIDARKRLTMRLLASGDSLAARAVAQTVDGGVWRNDEGLIRLRATRALLSSLDASSPDAVPEDELCIGVARTLKNVRIEGPEIEAAWVELATAASVRFGPAIRSLVPELSGGDIAGAAHRQRTVEGTVTPLFGGDPLRLRIRDSSEEAAPVLWAPGHVVQPAKTVRRTAASGEPSSEVEFAISRLPRGVSLQPAFLFADGAIVSAYADADVPEYRPFENVLYEQAGAWIQLERRAHWVVRAPRRLALKALSAVRRRWN
ncbi:glycosyltransferase family 2 protein [Microbacterium sp. YMB-B2]|uniref:Glycosyltransferase family 2 protein n=1 Tax=Microbacterium tenebrionis TaxID=2830665 RepID=A0A9X1LPF6_9MICO|nr:glycosyltransferase [Microbacterium tenebrionis]MCC2029357.1 glycosyltransferase family 2 protein [Microbacterium tenebrionis]